MAPMLHTGNVSSVTTEAVNNNNSNLIIYSFSHNTADVASM